MPDTCVFCGAIGTNWEPEHWVSQWISRARIPKGKGIQHHVPGRDPWASRYVDLTVPHICPDCNHHWLSDMESRVRDIALPLIEGDAAPRILTEKDQERLAAWCFLKTISVDLGRPLYEKRTYTDAIYTGFKRFKMPPQGCLISIGFREMPEDPPMFVWFRTQRENHPDPFLGDLRGYRAAFAIEHLVIDVIGVFAASAVQVHDADQRLMQIWPVKADLGYPPALRFKGVVNDDLV